MAIFEEKKLSLWPCAVILALLFLLAYPFWHLGDRELFWSEGEYAGAAMEQTGFPPVIRVHDVVQTRVYPLYPLLVKTLSYCGFSMEFSLRAVSVLSLLGTAVIVFLAGLRTGGLQSAAAGTTVMLTTLLMAEKAVEGYPQTLTMLILFGGWMVWFELTLGRGRWTLAWLFAGIFGALAFYNAGMTGLLYFALPIMLQQRPLYVWNKLRYSGLVIGVAIILFAIFLWQIPLWNLSPETLVQERTWQFSSVLKNLFMFPVDVFFRLLPWSLILWAPFCAALIPLDSNPLFGKFNRILFWTLLVLLWLNPETKSRDILYLVPVVSVMIGSCYWIVVRRFGYRILLLLQISGWILLLGAASALVYMILPEEFIRIYFDSIPSLGYRDGIMVRTVTEIALAAGFTIAGLCFCRKKYPVWIVYALFFTSAMILFWGIVIQYRAADHAKRNIGEDLRNRVLTEDGGKSNGSMPVIYKDSSISGLYTECYYMKARVVTVDVTKPIAPLEETVYLLTTGIPGSLERNWTRLYDSEYKNNRLYLYKGILRKDDPDDDF